MALSSIFRRSILSLACAGSVLAILGLAAPSARADVDQLQQQFATPPDNTRIMVRWWWFGPSITNEEIDKQLATMKAGGIGGFEVQQTYPLAIDDQPAGVVNLKFLSPEYLDRLKHTAEKAKELGLRMDITLGSGWPYGGPMFSADEGAGAVHQQWVQAAPGAEVPFPTLRPGETIIAAFSTSDMTSNPNFSKLVPMVIANGKAQFSGNSTARQQVMFIISSRTRMQVKRPAFGAEGNVIDHLSPTVVQKFIDQIGSLQVKAAADNPPFSIFCDSLEVGGEDWTPDFLAEFKKRRGYDLTPLLPALFGDMGPKTMEIRHDWGKTLTECFNDNFAQPLTDFAHKNNTKFRIQAYGSPSAGLYTYINSDLPEGEGYQWHGYKATRYASSACHLLNIPISSSETFTWLHAPVFRATPLDIKAEANQHFLQGINQLDCHGWPSTPKQVGFPGWSFYASAVFNDNNPWYNVMPDVAKYLQRSSFMLRQGAPANDVLLYLSNSDAWAGFTPGRISLTDAVGALLGRNIVPEILDSGYNLDFVDDGMIEQKGKVADGALNFGATKYKVIVLAGVRHMPISTLKALDEFAKEGGTVIATRSLPSIVPGYQTTEQDQMELKAIVDRLFNAPNAPGIFVSDEAGFPAALEKKLAPDCKLTPANPEVGFVHRHTEGGEVYFIANTSNKPVSFTAAFRDNNFSHVEQWDAQSAQATAIQPGTQLHLEPFESTFIVLSNRNAPAAKAIALAQAGAPMDISDHWTVQFGAGGAPQVWEKLHSWLDDKATQDFAGIASYSRQVNVPEGMLAGAAHVKLDLGQYSTADVGGERGGSGMYANLTPPVREAAVIYVNNQRVGSLWSPPYNIDITSQLKAGSNDIRIDVSNLAINYLAVHGYPNYDYAGITKMYGNRFQPQALSFLKAQPAGLLGKIQLVGETPK